MSNQARSNQKKLIIRYEDVSELEALKYAKRVIDEGRVSHNSMGKQFCYATRFADGINVAAFKPSSRTDTLVIYKEPYSSKKG